VEGSMPADRPHFPVYSSVELDTFADVAGAKNNNGQTAPIAELRSKASYTFVLAGFQAIQKNANLREIFRATRPPARQSCSGENRSIFVGQGYRSQPGALGCPLR
jgi:hypothetical protein